MNPFNLIAKSSLSLLVAGLLSSAIAGENCHSKTKATGDAVKANEIHAPGKGFDKASVNAISHEDFVKAVDAKSVIIIDVNGADSFQSGHIPGALDFSMGAKAILAKLPADKNAEIVAYCGGPGCEAWCEAAKEIKDAGYKNLRYYKGGKKGWMEAGLKLEKAEKKG